MAEKGQRNESRLPLPNDLGMGREADGASTPPIKSPRAQAAPHPEGIGIAYYLGTPILVTLDYSNGWVEGVFPDRENPGRAHKRQKPYTYTGRGPDAWRGRFWRAQVRFPKLLEARAIDGGAGCVPPEQAQGHDESRRLSVSGLEAR